MNLRRIEGNRKEKITIPEFLHAAQRGLFLSALLLAMMIAIIQTGDFKEYILLFLIFFILFILNIIITVKTSIRKCKEQQEKIKIRVEEEKAAYEKAMKLLDIKSKIKHGKRHKLAHGVNRKTYEEMDNTNILLDTLIIVMISIIGFLTIAGFVYTAIFRDRSTIIGCAIIVYTVFLFIKEYTWFAFTEWWGFSKDMKKQKGIIDGIIEEEVMFKENFFKRYYILITDLKGEKRWVKSPYMFRNIKGRRVSIIYGIRTGYIFYFKKLTY